MSISSFAIDITLPAFPEMVDRLDAPYATVQWTVTVYMFAAGLAQLVWGPASDRFGRRPVLAAGLSIFLLGSVLTSIAPSIEWLLAGRRSRGFGAAAAIVLARAILRDLYSGQELARNWRWPGPSSPSGRSWRRSPARPCWCRSAGAPSMRCSA
jgi:MFS transporter, DHA1 family, multidrug resistance protein